MIFRFVLILFYQLISMTQIPQWESIWGKGLFRRGPNAFILASVASGFAWYFAKQQIENFNTSQRELIRRVEQDETAENFKTNFNYHEADNWDCKKVNLDGVIKDGRFLIKRNRGKQEGYLILAPFIVNSRINDTNFKSEVSQQSRTAHRKFILNLGWIPKTHKQNIFNILDNEAFNQEVYTDRTEALQKEAQDGIVRDPLNETYSVPVTNITAYVRKGEKEDKGNGRINWKNNYLYKWIDLTLLTRTFRVFNEQEGEAIYLERTFKNDDDAEGFPIQASKQTVIEELKNQTKFYENNTNRARNGITGLAFGLAAWMTFL